MPGFHRTTRLLMTARSFAFRPVPKELLGSEPSTAALDAYLSPHSDDVCFSIGALATIRKAGNLVTVFTTSSYIEQLVSLSVDPDERRCQVTTLRRAEDERFAAASGLRLLHLGFPDAPLRRRMIFDRSFVPEDAALVETKLLKTIESLGAGPPNGRLPWLFCPMGIGGHLDHLVVLQVVLNNIERLRASYRIAFYEDLPYASLISRRLGGISTVVATSYDRQLTRYTLGLGKNLAYKMSLIRIYSSQFSELPKSLTKFTPAGPGWPFPHEAVWAETD